MSTVHLNTNIITAVNAIDAEEIDPIVDYKPYLIVLDTSNKELGCLRYTRFLKETRVAIDSYEARYATYHTMHQVLRHPLSRWKFSEPLITELPGQLKPPMPDPMIIPGCY